MLLGLRVRHWNGYCATDFSMCVSNLNSIVGRHQRLLFPATAADSDLARFLAA